MSNDPRRWLRELSPPHVKEPDLGPYMKVRHVARELGVSRQTIYRVLGEGQLPFSRLGSGRGTIRIRRNDLLAFLEQVKASAEQAT